MAADVAATARLELAPAQLRRRCDPETLELQESPALNPADGLIGQRRAAEALSFGLAMGERGFNVYVSGAPATGKTSTVRAYLEQAAQQRPTPDDWCYVHNFRDPSRPRALRLPAGRGRKLRDDLQRLIQAARREIPRAFESEEYITRREAIIGELNRRREQGLGELSNRAQSAGFALQVTPVGLVLIPIMGNRPLSDEELARLPAEMRSVIERNRELMEGEIRAFLKEMRAAERQTRERLEAQDREVALHAVGGLVDDLLDDYADQPDVGAYLAEVREGILADIALFRALPLPADEREPHPSHSADPVLAMRERALHKYEVNVIIDNSATRGAPVVMEGNPTYPNLVGRIEREAMFGTLVTDLTLITPGALHRANGGYLLLRIEDVLRAPLAWDALKRSLREGAVEIEDPTEALGLITTRGLRPDPIPLDVKVFLIGDPLFYYLLYSVDPDFCELFKVRADFAPELERTPANEAAYSSFLAACASRSGRPIDRSGLARIIEEASRMVADQRKLSARLGEIIDLVHEASYWAGVDGAAAISAAHVRKAVEQRVYRAALVKERLREAVARGVLLVRPEGEAVGQALGLSVIETGDLAFGQPTRITATVGAGQEGVLDIERQAELGGRIHTKAVMILGGYLADTYAGDKPLALSARLVFEQSYSEVEGDSASLAELLALLSRLANVPLRQTIAITGSVNQRGEVQAVGGVNEKIEGFFETCLATTGLTGAQGVVIPAANVEHLMLRDDVVEAVAAGKFHVYAVRTTDEALELLTGLPAGPRRPDGTFPPDGIHARVDARLRALAETLCAFSADGLGRLNRGRRARARHS